MPDTEFCLGPKEGYDPQTEADDPCAVRETNDGSTTEIHDRSLYIAQLQAMLSATMAQSSNNELNEQEFCCGPTEEWVRNERMMAIDSSQNGLSDPDAEIAINHQMIIGDESVDEQQETQNSIEVLAS